MPLAASKGRVEAIPQKTNARRVYGAFYLQITCSVLSVVRGPTRITRQALIPAAVQQTLKFFVSKKWEKDYSFLSPNCRRILASSLRN